MRHIHTFLIAMAAMTAGCMGTEADVARFESDLAAVQPGTAPLEELGTDTWHSAPAGCEGRLASSARLTFHVASLNDHLVAAVDREGDIVCVDTVEAVQEELESTGEEDRADQLGDQFLIAMSLAYIPSAQELLAGDPTPQPNHEGLWVTAGQGSKEPDPTPQPNSR